MLNTDNVYLTILSQPREDGNRKWNGRKWNGRKWNGRSGFNSKLALSHAAAGADMMKQKVIRNSEVTYHLAAFASMKRWITAYLCQRPRPVLLLLVSHRLRQFTWSQRDFEYDSLFIFGQF